MASNPNPYAAPTVASDLDVASSYDGHFPAATFTNPKWLAGATNVSLIISIVVSIMAVVCRSLMERLMFRSLEGTPVSSVELLLSYRLLPILTLLYFVARPIAGIIFCWWTYRVGSNLRALAVEGQWYRLSWAVGCNFVPVLNLFMPFLALLEIWRGSDPGRLFGSNMQRDRILGVWWMLHVFNLLLTFLTLLLSMDPHRSPELFIALNLFLIAIAVLFQIPRDLLQILCVRRITANQLARRNLILEKSGDY